MLAFWTGKDIGRSERLMRRSALMRDKWDDHGSYLVERTIKNACSMQRDVLQDKTQAAAPQAFERIIAEDPLATARTFVRLRHFHDGQSTLKHWQGQPYRWQGGAWREITTADVRAGMYAFIDSNGFADFRPNQTRVSNALDALQHAPEVHLDSTFVAPGWLDGVERFTSRDVVACKNGLLHLPTRTLHPATPLFFNFNALPYEYEPNAAPPAAWLQFLASVWPDDPESIATLQDLFGYFLTPDTSQHKIPMLIGPQRCGKGTTARVLTEVLGGDANVAGPTLSGMATQFGLEPLIGKLLAIISDARLGTRTDTAVVAENLLRVSGEDRVTIDRKNKRAISTKLSTRFLLMSNELPRIADASGALASRFIILQMRQTFLGREDTGLTQRLLAELPSILNWAIDGWHRLHQRGHFIEPKTSAEAVRELADLGSPVGAFVRERCEIGPAHVAARDDIYLAWCTWAIQQGHKSGGSKESFGRDLRAALPLLGERQPWVGTKRQRQYVGVGLRPGG